MRFVSCGTTVNYGKVIEILKQSIQKHLHTKKHLSISFFIRQDADIFMSHGCADKNYRSMSKCEHLKKFKYIFVPGEWLKNKLVNLGVPIDKIYCVGWPKIDLLFSDRNTYLNDQKQILPKIKIKKKIKKDRWVPKNKKIKVLWAPSHNKYLKTSDCSSFPLFNKFFRRLSNNPNIDACVSLHPRNNDKCEITTFKLSNCDCVIADYGSTIYEAWALGIPVIFPSWLVASNIIEQLPGSAEAYIYNNKIGIHARGYEDLISKIITHAPPLPSSKSLNEKVKTFMSQYLPSKYNGKSGLTIADLMVKLSKNDENDVDSTKTLIKIKAAKIKAAKEKTIAKKIAAKASSKLALLKKK
jgi:hypothetical protein